jgi:hypothetical protein
VFLSKYDYALFYAGFLPGAMVDDWLSHPEECTLSDHDSRPGHTDDMEQFQLPDLHENTNSMRLNSNENDNYATLPWPHNFHACQIKGDVNWQRPGDMHPLVGNDEDPYYIDFFEGHAVSIHDTNNWHRPEVRQDAVVIREVDGIGWINEITGSGRQYNVTVDGLRFMDCRVVLKSKGSADQPRSTVAVSRKSANFSLGSAPWPPLTFVMLRDAQELDRREYTPPLPDAQANQPSSETALASMSIVAPSPSAPQFPTETATAELTALPVTPTSGPLTPTSAPQRKPDSIRTLRVVVASPGDVQMERDSLPRVLDEVNSGVAGVLGLRLELWRWEIDAYPGFHANGPQGQIDQSMRIDEADIVIGVFWKRFGTPVADAQSGTEHELQRAYEAWKKSDHPVVMLYFNQQPYAPTRPDEFDQWRAVLEFRNRVPKEMLWWTYEGSGEFPDLVRGHLQRYLREHYPQR